MRVGDLVTLSAKGHKLQRNWRIVGAIGIVLEVIEYYSYYDYRIRWTTTKGGLRNYDSFMLRYELKYLKAKKN
jgi:hypothetical protein